MGAVPSSFDAITARRQVDDDEELLREVILLFIQDHPKRLEDLRKSLESRDAALLERAAHTIKGSCVIFGAKDAQLAAHELELLGRSGDFGPAPNAIARLSRESERLIVDLKGYLAAPFR
jgi:HPt (histidine-containing phosphotransfer) domain-containing protein